MQCVLAVGMSGAGKTSAARRIAPVLGADFHEMDALAIGPAWSRPPTFLRDVAALVAEPRWVLDSWGDPEVRDLMWSAADTVVWLDYPRRVVLPRLVRRSLQRSWRRTPVFGGNVETWSGWLSAGHPLWHAVTTFGRRRAYLAARTVREPGLSVVRLRTSSAFEQWLAELQRGAADVDGS